MNRSLSRPLRMLLAAFLVAAGALVAPQAIQAGVGTTLTVNSNLDDDTNGDGYCTLREAMTAALNDSDWHECTASSSYGTDDIVFTISGDTTITLGSPLPLITGDSTSILGFNGGSPVTINGANAYRPFDVGTSGALVLDTLTLQNGYSASAGAGIYNSGDLEVYDVTFLSNAAGSEGGAIKNSGTARIVNSTFSGNSASYGGAIANNNGTLVVLNSTFTDNSAGTHGAALSTWTSGIATITAIDNTIMANSTGPEDCWNAAGSSGGNALYGGNNIIESTTSDGTSCSSIVLFSSNPLLGAMTGLPSYFPLGTNSPAIDAGSDTVCANYPVYNYSQNGIPRPQDGNHDTIAVCDIGSYEAPVPVTYKSTGSRDGWVLESTETSGQGGSTNAGTTTLRLGDDGADRQYRSILSFGTSSLPDDAVVVSAKLKLRDTGLRGSNPFSSMGTIRVDMRRGVFGSSSSLEDADFQAAASRSNAASVPNSTTSGWYTKALSKNVLEYINRTGVTQFRLRFATDDNDNGTADYLMLCSGDGGASLRPALVLTYYDPTP